MSSLGNVNNVASDALHLYRAANAADKGRDTVVVAWQGYDAPNWAQVAFQDAAEQGAKLLAADVNAMRTTHGGPIRMLTVVAHSYGSTTTGLALQREHLSVDQVALIGSPGVGGDAKTVADLHLLPSQVFVGSASTDIVTESPGLLGANPADVGFGGTRVKAEVVGRGSMVNFGDHSHYFDEVLRGESLYTLAEIAAGHGDRLAQDGMLAQPRYIKTVTTGNGSSARMKVDPEASRTPSTGHDHANDVLYELRKPGP
jgi:pimeloyl-ACP methyl ester carboxylesterase